MSPEEIAAYQDGAYDALKKLSVQIRECPDIGDAIKFIHSIIRNMEEISTRKLGRQP